MAHVRCVIGVVGIDAVLPTLTPEHQALVRERLTSDGNLRSAWGTRPRPLPVTLEHSPAPLRAALTTWAETQISHARERDTQWSDLLAFVARAVPSLNGQASEVGTSRFSLIQQSLDHLALRAAQQFGGEVYSPDQILATHAEWREREDPSPLAHRVLEQASRWVEALELPRAIEVTCSVVRFRSRPRLGGAWRTSVLLEMDPSEAWDLEDQWVVVLPAEPAKGGHR